MPSDYDKIRADNILEYGQGTRHLSFLGRLYTDRTHFVFELLQNAEDAGASRILFRLFNDRLEVTHNGRPFNELDVRGVCGVGEGTKAEDLTQIGKFGIGFKSVYAYTSTPEVHSGDESFRIENYVRSYPVETRRVENPWTTLFVFAFDAVGIDPETACREIGTRLRNLSARTLLFLRKINEIEYKLPDRTGGVYLREEVVRGPARQVTVIGQNNGKDEDENWLIFERPVPVPDGSYQVRVEVGFRLEISTKDETEGITRIKDARLVVYFPTEKATRFGFLIQGPYRTTPSRDNIPKDDDWNETLVRETAQLLTDVLPYLKELGLLSVSLLEALPIRMDDFPEDSMFYPIVVAVREAIMNQDLLPTDDGTFVSARNAKLASAEWLRKLLREEQLLQMFKTEIPLKWISGEITERAKNDLWKFIREELEIEEITPDSFARKVDLLFFEKQTDEWFIEFFKQLAGQKDLWKKGSNSWRDYPGPLRAKSFIRLQNGRCVKPFRDDNSPNVYLPVGVNNETSLPIVKVVLTEQEDARRFLTDLGIPELDIVAEVIEHIIQKYLPPSLPVSSEEHKRDIEKIEHAYKTDSQEKKQRLKEILQETAFILSRTPVSDNTTYRKLDELYFPGETLEMYFAGNSEVGFVSSIYQESVIDMFKDLGVGEDVRVCKRSADHRGFIKIYDSHGWHRRGLYGFDPEIHVEGLEHALTSPTLEKSAFIWNHIAIPNSACIRGTVEKSSRQTYENCSREERISEFGRLLIENSWLPGSCGVFEKASQLYLYDLPEPFERNEKLADLLGMKKDAVAILAEKAGIQAEDIELMRQHPEEFQIWKAAIVGRNEKPIFPMRPVANPEHRQKRLAEQLADAPKKEYEERERSVRTTRGTVDPTLWLMNQYTNDTSQMVCQICKQEMPFKKRDGEYYFEAVEALSMDYFSREHEAQFLALCPLCAARYKEFVKQDEVSMENFKNTLINSAEPEIPLQLGDLKTSVQFVESHILDIRTIIETQ